MDDNERIIYRYIKAAANKGIWIKDLKAKSQIHSKNVQDAIKSLEKKQIIKSVKSVKNPIKKVYMLSNLVPSEEVTGGTWYTDQEFDAEFIEGLSRTALRFVESRSFPPVSADYIFSKDYDKYPTVMEIRDVLLGIVDKSMVNLSLADTLAILDRLIYDGKIVRIPRRSNAPVVDYEEEDDNEIKRFLLTPNDSGKHWAYKAIKRNTVINALRNIPCGKCPVFNECADTGPITPLTCQYFQDWIHHP
jgi:DNA-directed RNA polymerase III subunit RPC6